VYGRADGIVSYKQGEYLHSTLPHSRLLVLPDCAHAPHLHDKVTLRHTITEWENGHV
jgi:pimeloyl-ACP methyl ester carboxylesterase